MIPRSAAVLFLGCATSPERLAAGAIASFRPSARRQDLL
jgi:hypothetical protein